MRILFLTHRLPYAPNRGDRIRAYHLLRGLARDCEVHLFSLATHDELMHVAEMRTWLASVATATPQKISRHVRAVAALAGHTPLTHVLVDGRHASKRVASIAQEAVPDVVFAYCSGMARFAVEGPLDRLPCVVDMVDVDSMKWNALGAAHGPLSPVYRREARVLARFEAAAAKHAAVTLVVNEREREALRRLAPSARIEILENGVDTAFFAPTTPPAEAPEVVFCGVMDYAPNVEGACWFVTEVWPVVRTHVPTAHLTVVGSRPVGAVRALAAQPGVEITGEVADVRPYLWRAAVAVTPLLTARGIQNKALEALAAGIPVVATPAVAAGLPGNVLSACSTAQGPEDFARRIISILDLPPSQRRQLAGLADLRPLSWDKRLCGLSSLVREAVSTAHQRM